MAITDKKTGPWGLDQVYNKINQGSIWDYAGMANLFMWGHNDNGNLGQNQSPGTLDSGSSPVQIPGSWAAHYKGYSLTNFAVKTDGTAWVWGANGNGVFGTNQTSGESHSPIQIGTDTTWSTEQGKYNCATNNACSSIKADGTLWWWGSSVHGYDGTSNGSDTEAYRRSSPVQVGSDSTWAILANDGGYGQNLATKTDGTLWSWGYNARGGLGQNNQTFYSSPIQIPGTTWSTEPQKLVASGQGGVLAIKTDGTLWSWGDNQRGQLGQNSTAHKSSPVQVPGTTWKFVGGRSHIRNAIKTDGTLWAWGRNSSGSLGQGNTTDYSSPVQVGSDTTWTHCECFDFDSGAGGMMATKTDGTLWMWGDNEYGGLGQNNRTDYSSPKQIPGTLWSGETLTSGKRTSSCIQAD